MKKLLLLSLLTTAFYTGLHAKATQLELWNKSKTPFYVGLTNDFGHFVAPKTSKNRPRELITLKGGGRTTLADYDGKDITLIISDNEKDWLDNFKAYAFLTNKTIYVRIKDRVKKLNDLSPDGFGPQTGPWKGLKGKTESGLSLKNNVKSKDIIDATYSTRRRENTMREQEQKQRQPIEQVYPIEQAYQTLGVSKEATPRDIKVAYNALVKKWHPDRNSGNRAEANKKFNEIKQAYDLIK